MSIADPRHTKREAVMKALFSVSFNDPAATSNPLISSIYPQINHIDGLISACAPEWPIPQINKVDLAILRQAVFELLEKQVPYKVVIDEAVELAKEYGSDHSAKFVNGVLGSVINKVNL